MGDALNLDTANCAPLIFCNPAYDSLTHINASTGALEPGLAASWKWVDGTHQVFELTLRTDAKFNDGTPLTGENAAASINSYLSAPGPFASLSYPIEKAAAKGTNKLDIYFAEPLTDRYALYLLAGQSSVGFIIGPKSAANRDLLLTNTDGIGPYKLDPKQTIKSVQYVYVPNEQYYNKSAITYTKIVLKPMPNPQSRLNAIRSHEVDWAVNVSTRDLSVVEQAGFTISRGQLGSFSLLALMKRASGPLADVRVRQALAYAVPRDDIAKALYGDDAVPTSSVVPEGAEGYNAEDVNTYAYNPDKAKALLAEAGYAQGLTLTVFDPSFFDPGSSLGEALKAAMAKVGVTLNLVTSDAPPGNIAQEVATGKYDAEIMSNGGNGVSAAVYTMFRPNALANPLGVPLDSQLTSLLDDAATTTDPSEQEKKAQAATAKLDELVLAVPIASIPTLQAVSKEIQNVPSQYWTVHMNPFSPVTGEAWRTAD